MFNMILLTDYVITIEVNLQYNGNWKPLKKERLILKSTIWCQQSIHPICQLSTYLQSLKLNG